MRRQASWHQFEEVIYDFLYSEKYLVIGFEPGLHSELLMLGYQEDNVLGPVVLHPKEGGGSEQQGHRDILDKQGQVEDYLKLNRG